MKTRARVLEHLQTKFPALKDASLADLISENLFADHVLQLPKDIAAQAEAFAAACFELRHNSNYQQHMSTESQARRLKDPGNDAIATSYDFHVDASGVLKLIEINTNASFLALGDELYEALALPRPFADHSNAELKKCFEKEFELCGLNGPMRVAIVDEKPLEQRLYIEFLVYRELMKTWGLDVRILDTADDLTDRNFIYNRDTDFFL